MKVILSFFVLTPCWEICIGTSSKRNYFSVSHKSPLSFFKRIITITIVIFRLHMCIILLQPESSSSWVYEKVLEGLWSIAKKSTSKRSILLLSLHSFSVWATAPCSAWKRFWSDSLGVQDKVLVRKGAFLLDTLQAVGYLPSLLYNDWWSKFQQIDITVVMFEESSSSEDRSYR